MSSQYLVNMSTIEMNSAAAAPKEDQKGSPSVLMEISTPINFAERTAAEFGITVQSFIPSSLPSSNHKEKSRLAQLKARRRSNIGVRGSPETNSLIRFIAQQRMKTPPAHGTPKLVKSSPFLPRVASTLRQKMASFQNLMGVEESEDGSSGGCITTRDDLSDGRNLEAGKENHSPLMALPPNKKRRLGRSQGCESQIRDDTPLHSSLNLEEEETSLKHKPPQPSESEEAAAQGSGISPALIKEEQPVSDAQLWSATEDQQEVAFELQRIQEPSPNDPTAESSAQPAAHFHSPSISSLLEMKPTADSLSNPTVRKKKKKQVRFGDPLPPELFDKNLPPSTPLQKGGTPARAPTPGGALRSLLKTPQRSDSPSAQQHPEVSSPSVFGASPALSMPRCRRMATSEDDDEQMSGKIPFPLEEIEIEAAIAEESFLNVQPLNLDSAFHEESLSHIETECETKAAESASPTAALPPEPLQQEELPPQTDAEAQAPGTSRRRGKLPEESEPVKRSSRAAAKTASGKMKSDTATRRWNKKVDLSLYGSREYASKNPSLSPITERLSPELSCSTEEPLAESSSAPGQEPQADLCCNGNSVSSDPAPSAAAQTADMTALNASTTPQVSLSLPQGATRSGVRRTRRLSGSKVTGRPLKGRKVSVNDEQAEGRVCKRSKESEAFNNARQEEKEEAELNTVVEGPRDDVIGEICATNLLEAATDVNGEPESQATSFSPTKEAKQSLGCSVELSPDSHPDAKLSHDIQLQNQQENTPLSSNNQQKVEAAAAQLSLLLWQDDFNCEDVFKPAPTRGQRSVRRSLRNKSSVDPGCCDGGTAWLPHTSPETVKEQRRRTRGRRLSAALPGNDPQAWL